MYITPRINVFKPFLSVTVAMVVTGLLIALDYSLIFIESHIVAGLWIILLMSILFMITQIAHIEKTFSKQFAQFAAQKERLASEIKHRIWAEKTSSENKTKLQIVDENFPVMLAYFNTEQRCRYHNRAFRQWFGLQPEQIENRRFNEFLDKPLFSDIDSAVERVLSGETKQNQHILQLANQSMCFITSYLTPHFDSAGKVIGFYILYIPRLMKKGERLLQNVKDRYTTDHKQAQESETTRDSNENTAEHPTRVSIDSSRRIIQAIEQNEFHLYCQKIISVGSNQESLNYYYEVLIRMAEEESNLIPPGAFLPFVEKYNLMPRLDSWVVEQAIYYLADQRVGSRTSFCINLARSTLIDSVFADRVRKLLNASGIAPRRICFEIETADMAANLPSAVQFVKKIQQGGCLISLCGFNHDHGSFDLLKHIRVDFLKIDGGLICNILRDAEDLKKVENISKFARALKIKTIGELVETRDILEKLAKIGIDYAQGFMVGRPLPIEKIERRADDMR